jgi:hypothetical protein
MEFTFTDSAVEKQFTPGMDSVGIGKFLLCEVPMTEIINNMVF